MSLAERREKLREARGNRIFDQVMADIARGVMPERTQTPLLTRAFAVFILALPVVFILWGSWALYRGQVMLGVIVVLMGGVLLLTFLRSRQAETEPVDACPTLRGVLGRICQTVDAPPIDRIVVDAEFNAYMSQSRRGSELGIGALLWQCSEPEERLALLGHEVAHLVNGDPERDHLVHWALAMLAGLYDVVEPDWDAPFASAFLLPFALAIELAYAVLIRSAFGRRQRAEYLADILAARVAGTQATLALMRRLTLAPLLDDHMMNVGGTTRLPEGRAMLSALSLAFSEAREERVSDLLAEARRERHSIDETHPATRYREDVLGALPETAAAVVVTAQEWATIDAELAPWLDRMGTVWTGWLEVQ